MKNRTELAFALLILAALIVSEGCLNMTPRTSVPDRVVINITSIGNCSSPNCTCLVEGRRPRYTWWSCNDGAMVDEGNIVQVPSAIYNSSLGENCTDIRMYGGPNYVCFQYDQFRPGNEGLWHKKANCKPWCSDHEYNGMGPDGADCNLACSASWTGCRCAGLKSSPKYQLACPLQSGTNCECSQQTITRRYWSIVEGRWIYYNVTNTVAPCVGGACGTVYATNIPDTVPGTTCISTCTSDKMVSYQCTGMDGRETFFTKCTPHYETSFQGGSFQTIRPCNATAMQNIVQDPFREMSFFMVGQGATFDAFSAGRAYCTPNITRATEVRLGDSVFHPRMITITNGSRICWESDDIAHDLILDGGSGAGTFPQVTRLCLDNLTLVGSIIPAIETHTMRDGFTGEISFVNVSSEGVSYIEQGQFIPQYLIVPKGRDLFLQNLDSDSHSVRAWDNQWGEGAPFLSTSLGGGSGMQVPTASLGLGPNVFQNVDNGAASTVFVLSNGSDVTINEFGVSPTEVAIRQGDSVCMTCAAAYGHVLSIYRVINVSQYVFFENRTLGAERVCCWRPPPGTYLVLDLNTSARFTAYVTENSAEYKVRLHDYNFDPQVLMVKNGTEVCFRNPSDFPRTVTIDSPASSITIPANNRVCGYFPARDIQHVRDVVTDVNMTIISYSNRTTFINMSSLGAQPQFPMAGPDGRICFANVDSVPHNITRLSDGDCMPWGGLAPVPVSETPLPEIQPKEVGCYELQSEGAFMFRENSQRADPQTGRITRTDTNVTVLSNYPSNYTYYILDEPPQNGSIQPPWLFILSNDTVRWADCRNFGYHLVSSSNLTDNMTENPLGMDLAGPLDTLVWYNFSVGSFKLVASLSSDPNVNLTARLYVADMFAYSEKIEFPIYTGPATRNNNTLHLAVNWLSGDIGAYTLYMARAMLGNRSFTAFPLGLSNRVLVGLHPKDAHLGNILRVPSGSNVTWENLDNESHLVDISWVGAGGATVPAYPGRVTYNEPPPNSDPITDVSKGIPAGSYSVSEPSTGLSYPVEVYNQDEMIDIGTQIFNPNTLSITRGRSVCFTNYGAMNVTLNASTPSPGFIDTAPGVTIAAPKLGPNEVYVIDSTVMPVPEYFIHDLEVMQPADYALETVLAILCDGSAGPNSYRLSVPSGTKWASSTTITISYPVSYPGCNQRQLFVDGVSIGTFTPGQTITWAVGADQHLFQVYADDSNTIFDSSTIYFKNSVGIQNPMLFNRVVLRDDDTIEWTNPAAFGGDRIRIREVVEPQLIVVPVGATSCFTPEIAGDYKVDMYGMDADQSLILPAMGTMGLEVTAGSGSGADYVNLLRTTMSSSVMTSPLSTVCWRSSDGNVYGLETMQGTRNVGPTSNPIDQYCWTNMPLGTFIINETSTGMATTLRVAAGNYSVPMFYDTNSFDPPSAVIRPGTEVCLRNYQSFARDITMCRWVDSGGNCVETCAPDPMLTFTLFPGDTRCIDPESFPYPAVCFDPRPLYNFSDSATNDKFEVNVTQICEGGNEVYRIARKVNKYDADVFTRPQYDREYYFNEHGPAWPSIITSEVGQADASCACRQLINITAECANCTSALAVEYSGLPADWTYVQSALNSPACNANTDVVALFVDGNSLLQNVPPVCDSGCNCNFSVMWKTLGNFSKRILYAYGKPSVVLSFKLSPESAPSCWNGETISKMYKDFYANQITQLAAAGLFGLSQACLEENSDSGDCFVYMPPDGMGLIDSGNTRRNPQFDAWFGRCAAYYYNSEGLTMETFSAEETNSTLCDGSRLFDLYQKYKCYAD